MSKPKPKPDPALCGAKTKTTVDGRPCRKVAGQGTDHVGWGRCHKHGGNTPSGKQYGAAEQAKGEAAKLGVELPVDPHEALSAVVGIFAGQVRWLQRKVGELDEGEALTKDELHPTIRAMNGVLEQWQRSAKAAADAGSRSGRCNLTRLYSTTWQARCERR